MYFFHSTKTLTLGEQINRDVFRLCVFIMSHTRFRVNLFSYLNVRQFLARRRRDIWDISDCNRIRTHNHLVRKGTLFHLAKLSIIYKLSGYELGSCCSHVFRSLPNSYDGALPFASSLLHISVKNPNHGRLTGTIINFCYVYVL